MSLLLFNLLQSQTKLSWVVIAAAVIALAAGISLLVYFYKRYKRIEKETEDDWDASRHSLFVNAKPAQPKTEAIGAMPVAEAALPVSEEADALPGVTREFAADMNLPSFASASSVEPKPPAHPEETDTIPVQASAAPPEPQPTEKLVSPVVEPAVSQTAAIPVEAPIAHEAHPTEKLVSPTIEPIVSKSVEATAPLEDDLWAALDVEKETASQPTIAEPATVARVEDPARLEPFDPPRIERIARGEAYEPPTIEPLTPRQAATTRELRSMQPFGKDPLATELPEERVARPTATLGSLSERVPRPLDPPRAGREAQELKDTLAVTAPVNLPEKPVSAGVAQRARSFGSVLGLPAESSDQPLILGKTVKPADEMGIGALTHYGQDLGPKGGRAGKIALLLILALLAGAAAAYVFIPSVHSRVDGFIARLRGNEALERDSVKTKAQIIPSSRPEVNKNLVTARGAIDNISDEPLTGLEVEVSLRRGDDSQPEVRRVSVVPDPLPPGERGQFEFEYDGKRDTGFAGYTITRLFSNGVEVRFRTPPQK